MISNFFSRPNNKIINNFGFGSTWNSYQNSNIFLTPKLNIQHNLISLFLIRFFKSGLITTFHIFFKYLFFSKKITLSLPVFLNASTLYKFYIIKRIKMMIYFLTKKEFLIKKTLWMLNSSQVFIYRIGSTLLCLIYFYLPQVFNKNDKHSFILKLNPNFYTFFKKSLFYLFSFLIYSRF